MKKSPMKFLFTITMILSTIMSMTANSWLGVWMGLEINLLSFIPLMSYNSMSPTETSSIKYFIVQTIGSITLITVFIISMINKSNLFNSTLSTIMTMAMVMKIGGVPFHFWLPEVMENLSWNNCMLIMTWQKMAPMTALSYIQMNNYIMTMLISLSATVGAILGMNQISLRMLMAYSSINHIAWMMAAMMINVLTWFCYITVYFLLVIMITFMLKSYNVKTINELFLSHNSNKINKIMMLTSILSLGGMPPMVGFLPKWILIQELGSKSLIFILYILIITSAITLYFYLKIFISGSIIYFKESSWNLENSGLTKIEVIYIYINSISILGLSCSMFMY
uniref:NADH-ubiquinone oxidoreductase chain 2 n=1 Tax=Paragavialidium sichuanense TaxID=2793213 RepID=A0A7U3ST26_9ORTH|nr:NADH dehydrogenase subunit 2 [Paragavialidium sichuanense]